MEEPCKSEINASNESEVNEKILTENTSNERNYQIATVLAQNFKNFIQKNNLTQEIFCRDNDFDPDIVSQMAMGNTDEVDPEYIIAAAELWKRHPAFFFTKKDQIISFFKNAIVEDSFSKSEFIYKMLQDKSPEDKNQVDYSRRKPQR